MDLIQHIKNLDCPYTFRNMLLCGENFHVQDESGRDALDWCIHLSTSSIHTLPDRRLGHYISLLLENIKHPNVGHRRGLLHAIVRSHLHYETKHRLLRIVLDHGADPLVTDARGKIPLYYVGRAVKKKFTMPLDPYLYQTTLGLRCYVIARKLQSSSTKFSIQPYRPGTTQAHQVLQTALCHLSPCLLRELALML